MADSVPNAGYNSAKLAETTRSAHIGPGGLVVTSNGQRLMSLYGDDALNPAYIVKCTSRILGMGDDELENAYDVSDICTSYADQEAAELEQKDLFKARDVLRGSRVTGKSIFETFTNQIPSPIAFERLPLHIQTNSPIYRDMNMEEIKCFDACISKSQAYDNTPLTVHEVVTVVRTWMEMMSKRYNLHDSIRFKSLVYDWLSSKSVLVTNKWKRTEFKRALLTIEIAYHRGAAHVGLNVGLLASQCLAELLVQIAFDSFHHTGSLNEVVNIGLPRANELTEMTSRTANPTSRIPLILSMNTKENATILAENLPALYLVSVSKFDVVSEPDVQPSGCAHTFPQDAFLIKRFIPIHPRELNGNELPLVLRWECDRAACMKKKLSMKDVSAAIKREFEKITKIKDVNMHHWSFSSIADKLWIIRLRIDCNSASWRFLVYTFIQKTSDKFEPRHVLEHLGRRMALTTILCGIAKIKAAYTSCIKQTIPCPITNKLITIDRHVVHTYGSNIAEVGRMEHIVDMQHLRASDFNEVHADMGVDAKVQTVEEELNIVIPGVDPRHHALLVACMSQFDTVMGSHRFGAPTKMTESPYALGAFEIPVDVLSVHSMWNTHDRLDGSVENGMLGQVTDIGQMQIQVRPGRFHRLASPELMRPFSPLFSARRRWTEHEDKMQRIRDCLKRFREDPSQPITPAIQHALYKVFKWKPPSPSHSLSLGAPCSISEPIPPSLSFGYPTVFEIPPTIASAIKQQEAEEEEEKTREREKEKDKKNKKKVKQEQKEDKEKEEEEEEEQHSETNGKTVHALKSMYVVDPSMKNSNHLLTREERKMAKEKERRLKIANRLAVWRLPPIRFTLVMIL